MDTAQQSLPPGTCLNQYEIVAVLGAGGFGITYRARDHDLQRDVAIKEFLPAELAIRDATATIKARESRADDYRYGLERFLAEARTLAQFDHPNIIRVISFFEAHGSACLVMPYVEGQTLAERLEDGGGRLDETTLRLLLIPLLDGLSMVHKAEFLHRDIKPGNIYLRADTGAPLLIDFGAARQAVGVYSRSVTGIVSAGYAPPEQYSTDPSKQGPWTDLYALGATLYRCISGQIPADSPTRQHALMEGELDPLRPAIEVGEDRYSGELLALTDSLLQLSSRKRPQQAAEVLELLRGSASPKPTTPKGTRVLDEAQKGFAQPQLTPAQPAPPIPPKTRILSETEKGFADEITGEVPRAAPSPVPELAPRRRWPAALLGLVLAGGLGAGGWYWSTQGTVVHRPALNTPDKPAAHSPSATRPRVASPPVSEPPLTRERLLSGTGIVRIDSDPAGAEVMLDDIAIGTTPLRLSTVRAGEYLLTLRHPTRAEYSGRLVVQADRVVKHLQTLAAAHGQLMVVSEPDGAWLELGGTRLPNTTPTTLERLPTGKHQLMIGKDGYVAQTLIVIVAKNTTTRQHFTLDEAKLGRLLLTTVPEDARIILPDIKPRYRDNLQLKPGRYRVRVKADGHRTLETMIELAAGQTTEKTLKLVPLATGGAIVKRIESLRTQIESLQIQIDEQAAREASIQGQLENEAPFLARQAKSDVLKLKSRLTDMYIELDNLRLNYQETYPDIVSLKKQIAELKREIAALEGDVSNPYYQALKARLAEVQVEKRELIKRKSVLEDLLAEEYSRSESIPEY